MIIEFVGSTGSGKTTLASKVRRTLARQAPVVTSFDLAAELVGLKHITRPTVQNGVQDLVGFPFFLRSLHTHRAFVALALSIVVREHRISLQGANYIRSIVRKIGIYELIQRRHHDRIVLVDEGTVLSASLLFVYTRQRYSEQELVKFATLVPLPELIVYVRAPLDTLVQRSLQRTDVRRELRSKDPRAVKDYVGRAARIFDRLSETERIRGRVLSVANPPCTHVEQAIMAERIARFVLEYEPASESISTLPVGPIEPTPMIGEIGAN